MSNVLVGNPWMIDTPSSTPVSTAKVRVKGVRWVGALISGHSCLVTDVNGHVKWESIAASPPNVEADTIDGKDLWDGVRIPTLDSGRLYIEFA